MHHDTGVSHVPWCMSGCRGNCGTCATRNLRILQEAHCHFMVHWPLAGNHDVNRITKASRDTHTRTRTRTRAHTRTRTFIAHWILWNKVQWILNQIPVATVCCASFCFVYMTRSSCIHGIYLPICFRVTSLGKSGVFHDHNEVIVWGPFGNRD